MADQEDTEKPADLKIILLGDSLVGKSKLVERFLMDDYVPRQLSTYALTLFRHHAEQKNSKGENVEVDFWDTAGQERFNTMHQSYYYRAHACILVFDVTRKATYKNLTTWYNELMKHRKGIPVIVCANKIDVNMEVTTKSFGFAKQKKLPFFFVSASQGDNVVKVFETAIEKALEYTENPEPTDFMEDVMRTLDYFDEKEKKEAKKEAEEKSVPSESS